MPTYQGLTILPVFPTKVDGASRREGLALGAEILRAPWAGGIAAARATGAAPGAVHDLVWASQTRAELATLLAFLEGLGGPLTAFWLPTERQDFTVTAASGADWTVTACDYTALVAPVWAALGASDHTIGVFPNGSYFVRRVTGAVDNGDGTETLTHGSTVASDGSLPASPTAQTTAAGLAAGLLRVARLTEEPVATTFDGPLAITRARAVELPRETPV